MKTLLTLSLMLSMFGCLRMGVKASGSNEKPDGAVIGYEYKYSGMMMYPLRWYSVTRDSTGVAQLLYSGGEPDITILRAPEDIFEKIASIAGEYKLHRLRGSYRPRMKILDGYMWHMYIRYEKGSISSGGSNAGAPQKLSAGISAINNYIEALIDAAGEEDVIGHDDHDSYYKRKYGR